jgi:DNA-binding SARP family transcriptional activator
VIVGAVLDLRLRPSADKSPLTQPETAPLIRLELLHGFELTQEGQPISISMTGQRVLAFLALQRRPIRRPVLAGTLWPETTDERAAANLRSALWRLHRCGLDVVQAKGDYLSLAECVIVDVIEMTERARRLLDARDVKGDEMTDAASFSGDLLPDWNDEWLWIERERVRQLRLHALEALCLQLVMARRFGAAVAAGLAAALDEPLRESAHQALITAYLAENNREDALRLYQRYRSRLHLELGVEPSVQLKSLVADLVMRR